MDSPDRPTPPPGTRTIAEALSQRESHQMDALEDLVATVMEQVAGEVGDQGLDVVQHTLADRLRAHLPVDSTANRAWLRERAALIVASRAR